MVHSPSTARGSAATAAELRPKKAHEVANARPHPHCRTRFHQVVFERRPNLVDLVRRFYVSASGKIQLVDRASLLFWNKACAWLFSKGRSGRVSVCANGECIWLLSQLLAAGL